MKSGFQFKDLTYLGHGEQIQFRFLDLMNNQRMQWILPTWFTEHATEIKNKLLPEFKKILTYQKYHDCGKYYCRIELDGKVHYPNHAEISAQIWSKLSDDFHIMELIRDDMLCHTLKPSEANTLAENKNCIALICTALCELHANAEMFGGLESDSFKIKFKRLSKLGNNLFKLLKEKS